VYNTGRGPIISEKKESGNFKRNITGRRKREISTKEEAGNSNLYLPTCSIKKFEFPIASQNISKTKRLFGSDKAV